MAGIYFHIPFCRKACNYCNFHFSTSLAQKENVLRAMDEELLLRRDFLQGEPVETIYFGGGTPSLLTYDELARFFDRLQKLFNLDSLQECTLEANPDDLNRNFLQALKRTPVNRFSMGVQSFFDEDLRYMNRAHDASQADYAIKAAQDAGFDNITIDLIYGTPGLSDKRWKENLQRVADYRLPHFSAYALTVEEDTALHRQIASGKQQAVAPEQSAAQFELLMDAACNMGFEHYEISNFALPGKQAVHNTNYWRGKPYLGIGPSAHSFDGRDRFANIAHNIFYAKAILEERIAPAEKEVLTAEQRLNELIMTSLRTMWGLDLNLVGDKWGATAVSAIKKNAESFLERRQLQLHDNILTLTDSGKLFADHIASELFFV